MQMFVRYFVVPAIRGHRWKSVCEIGASMGGSTDELLKLPLENYTVIDPCLDEDLQAKYSTDSRVKVLNCNSLDALRPDGHLPSGTSFDCILIDGDHNWYTVFNELRLIHDRALLRLGGYIFLHDVGWPYGRRDMYYQPDAVPEEFRHPFAQRGMIPGKSHLAETGGVNEEFANALEEGGRRNGVLTAVEDFIALYPGVYRFCVVRYQFGLGILQLRSNVAFSSVSFFQQRVKAAACSLFGQQGSALRARFKGWQRS